MKNTQNFAIAGLVAFRALDGDKNARFELVTDIVSRVVTLAYSGRSQEMAAILASDGAKRYEKAGREAFRAVFGIMPKAAKMTATDRAALIEEKTILVVDLIAAKVFTERARDKTKTAIVKAKQIDAPTTSAEIAAIVEKFDDETLQKTIEQLTAIALARAGVQAKKAIKQATRVVKAPVLQAA